MNFSEADSCDLFVCELLEVKHAWIRRSISLCCIVTENVIFRDGTREKWNLIVPGTGCSSLFFRDGMLDEKSDSSVHYFM